MKPVKLDASTVSFAQSESADFLRIAVSLAANELKHFKLFNEQNLSINSSKLKRIVAALGKRAEASQEITNKRNCSGFLTAEFVTRYNEKINRFQKRMSEYYAKHDVDAMMRNFKKAKATPETANSKPWLALDSLLLNEAVEVAPYLPSLVNRRGRPRRSGNVARELSDLLNEMDEFVEAGSTPTAAARKIVKKQSINSEEKSRVDYLVKLYRRFKKSGKK